MKRKAIGVLVFCLALFGAIVAGYWDLLNSEGLRLAEERAKDVVTRLSGMADPEEPADEVAARDGRAEEPSPNQGSGGSKPAGAGEDAAPAAVAPDAAVEVAAAGNAAAEAPAKRSVPATIVPAAPAIATGAPVREEGQQVADVPAGAVSGEGAPSDADAAGDVDPASGAAGAPNASGGEAGMPGAVGETGTPAVGAEPGETGDGEADVAAAAPADGDAEATEALPGHADAPEPLAPPRFDILRIETDGSTVIAGRAPAGSSVALVDAGRSIATETASAAGEFVVVLDEPLAPGDYQMRIEASLPDGKQIVSEEIAIVSVPQAGSEGELLAMVEAPDAASRLISVPSASPRAPDVASAEPAEGPAADPAGAAAELLLPQTAEGEAEGARTAVELPERVATFFTKARALSVDAGNLDDGGTATETVAVARDAASVAEEGRALAEELPLAEGPQEEGAAELTQLVREAADAAGDVAETANSVDLEQAAEAADRLAGLADEAGTRLASLEEESVGHSGSSDPDAASAAEPGGAAATLSVEAVEIENDTIYIAGRAEPGSTVRIYLDNDYLADDKVAAGDRFLVATNASVATGDHLVRADQVDANGTVTARAEVPFFKPEGAVMSAVAPPAPADPGAAAGAVEMLPATGSGAALPAEDDGAKPEAAGGGSTGDIEHGDVAMTDGAVSDGDVAEDGRAVAEAATPGVGMPSQGADVGEASSISNASGKEPAPGGEAASPMPARTLSDAPTSRPAGDAAGPVADPSGPSAPLSSDDAGRMAVAAASGEGNRGDDPGAANAGSASGSAAAESDFAAALAGPSDPAGSGSGFAAETTASDAASVPETAGEVGEAAREDAALAKAGTAEPSAEAGPTGPSAGRVGSSTAAVGSELGSDRPASGSEAPDTGGNVVAPSSEVTSATDPDGAPAVAAVMPTDELASAPGDASSDMAAAGGTPSAGTADRAGIAVNRQPQLEPADARVIIRKGDTLWEISRDTYGRGSRYTVIYLANGDQIRNPDRIYPGQVFRLPDDLLDSLDSASQAN